MLITSHLLSQVEDVCDRIAILERGRLVFEGAVAALAEDADRFVVVMSKLTTDELAALRGWLAERGRTIESVGPPRERLGQFFLRAVRRQAADRAGVGI